MRRRQKPTKQKRATSRTKHPGSQQLEKNGNGRVLASPALGEPLPRRNQPFSKSQENYAGRVDWRSGGQFRAPTRHFANRGKATASPKENEGKRGPPREPGRESRIATFRAYWQRPGARYFSSMSIGGARPEPRGQLVQDSFRKKFAPRERGTISDYHF